jgi:glycosyltransferase involved in cell wall biosynthesis
LPAEAPDLEQIHFYRRGHDARFAEAARRVDCWTPAHHRLERWTLGLEVWPHKLELLHSPDFIPPAWGAKRTVITVHDLTFLRYPEFLTAESRRYYNKQIAWAVERADAISADSHATAADLVELLGVSKDKITVIHLGVDESFQPATSELVAADAASLARLGLNPGYLLFVGTYEPRKNVPTLLRAYAQLRVLSKVPRLVLVGRPGWLFQEALDLAAQLRLDQHVTRLQDVPEADLPAVYRGAVALALPSHYEGFGFPVLEAMASGVPVVISNRASLPELAGDAALMVEPEDETALAEALWRLIADNQLRTDLSARGFERIKAFSWQATAQATVALYRRVLAG